MSKVVNPIHGKTYFYKDKDKIKTWEYRSGCTMSSLMMRWGVLYETKEDVQFLINKNKQ